MNKIVKKSKSVIKSTRSEVNFCIPVIQQFKYFFPNLIVDANIKLVLRNTKNFATNPIVSNLISIKKEMVFFDKNNKKYYLIIVSWKLERL
jgi:hypothetical protein